MTLSKADLNSPLWRALADYQADRLAALRAQNDGDLSPEQTAKLRGRIQEVQAFLALATERPTTKD